jgi:hypothetical protein
MIERPVIYWDAAEWDYRDRNLYKFGFAKMGEKWGVFKQDVFKFKSPEIVTSVDSREAAIGYVKLLRSVS